MNHSRPVTRDSRLGAPSDGEHGQAPAKARRADQGRLEREQFGQQAIERTRRQPEVGDATPAAVAPLEESFGWGEWKEQAVGVARVLHDRSESTRLNSSHITISYAV